MARKFNQGESTGGQRAAAAHIVFGLGERMTGRELNATNHNWPYVELKAWKGKVVVRTIKRGGHLGYLIYEGTTRSQHETTTHEAWNVEDLHNILDRLGVATA